MTVTIEDAKLRRWVTLPDGRTGRLVRVPAPGSTGKRARVQLHDGFRISVDVDQLALVKGKGHRGNRKPRRSDGHGPAQLSGRYWPVEDDEVPLLPNGKVDIRALCRRWDDAYNEALR